MQLDDAILVSQSLHGNRDAFCQVVERYQTLITSLAYCATGNVGLSEDIAQETFVRAWSQLKDLREPAKLRSWLCSIARFLIGKEFRRLGQEPVHGAQALEVVEELVSTEPSPPEQAISEEEKALLWRSLERIPQVYREPLILFYRENESIEAVARDLELSEDAVRQRLSRGRKLLENQLIAFVGGALRQTSPDRRFTHGVMATLPALATAAKVTTVAGAAGKGGPMAKVAGIGSLLSGLLTAAGMALLSLFGGFAFVGRWIGRKMGLASLQSPQGLRRTIQFWRRIAIGFAVLVLPPLASNYLTYSHPWFARAGTLLIGSYYGVVVLALLAWKWPRQREAMQEDQQTTQSTQVNARSYTLWVSLGMAGPAILVGLFLWSLFSPSVSLSAKAVPEKKILATVQSGRTDARYRILQYRDGSQYLDVALPENHRIDLSTPLDDSLRTAMKEKGITCQTWIEDRDFHNGGVRGWLVLLSTFIVAAGCVLLLHRPGTRRFHDQEIATPRAEMKEKRVLGICGALALGILSAVLAMSAFARRAQRISVAQAEEIVSAHTDCLIEVFQYDDGSRDLWITLAGSRHHPDYRTSADTSFLDMVASKSIPFTTFVQGRDFGYRGPRRWVLWVCACIMGLAAISLALWVVKSRGTPVLRVAGSS